MRRNEIEPVTVALIEVSNDRRPVNAERVEALAQSIAEIGLQSPICVRYFPDRKSSFGTDDSVVLVAGRHRLEAVRSLGLETIDAFFIDCDDIHAELIEIDENLMRNNLGPAEEAEAVARRKVIYETIHPETVNGENQHTRVRQIGEGSPADRFTAATAAATGKPERSIQRAAERGAKLGSDLKSIAGTSLDKGVELDALAKMAKEERAPLIERAKAGEKVSARTSAYTNNEAASTARRNEVPAQEKAPEPTPAWQQFALQAVNKFSHRELREMMAWFDDYMRPRAVK